MPSRSEAYGPALDVRPRGSSGRTIILLCRSIESPARLDHGRPVPSARAPVGGEPDRHIHRALDPGERGDGTSRLSREPPLPCIFRAVMDAYDSSRSGIAPNDARPTVRPARTRDELEAVFCAHLPLIEALAGSVARRCGFRPDDIVDAVAWVRLRLIEGDYAVIAKHRGESSIQSYLAIVVVRLIRDYRMMLWGRWRPSAAAIRNGSVAVRLETLTRRDRLPFEQAVAVMRSDGCAVSERELRRLHRVLPERAPLRPNEVDIGDPAIEDALAVSPTVDGAGGPGDRDARSRLFAAVDRAIRTLPSEDQLIIRLRYGEGLAIADVARTLGIAEKPLYRRLPMIVRRVREVLEAAGISRDDAMEVFADA